MLPASVSETLTLTRGTLTRRTALPSLKGVVIGHHFLRLPIIGGDGKLQLLEQIIDIGRREVRSAPLFAVKVRLGNEVNVPTPQEIGLRIRGIEARDRTGELWGLIGTANMNLITWKLHHPMLQVCNTGEITGTYNTRTHRGSLVIY